MLLTPDMKLIHAIYQVGMKGYYVARRMGVRADHLLDEAKSIFALMDRFVAHGRLPSPPEVHTDTGHILGEICPDPLDVALHAQALVKRQLTNELHLKLRDVFDNDAINTDPFVVRDKLNTLSYETAWSYGDPYSINSREAMDELKERYNRAKTRGNKLLGLSSPWPTVDAASLGAMPGELTVIFAKRKVGKSWILFAWLHHIWKNDLKPGEKLLLVSMEMTRLQCLQRLACIDLKFSWNEFREGKLISAQEKQLYEWCEARIDKTDNKPDIVIYTSQHVKNVEDMKPLVAEHQPKCVGVDSFYIMGKSAGKSLHERVLGNVQDLKLEIALEFEVPLLASTQLKGTVGKDTLDADSDDAMGAKAIGDYADVTRGLFADQELRDANQRLWKGMEAREFLPKDVKMNFDLDRMDFSEIEEIKAGSKDEGGKKEKKAKKPSTPKPTSSQVAGDAKDDEDDIYV